MGKKKLRWNAIKPLLFFMLWSWNLHLCKIMDWFQMLHILCSWMIYSRINVSPRTVSSLCVGASYSEQTYTTQVSIWDHEGEETVLEGYSINAYPTKKFELICSSEAKIGEDACKLDTIKVRGRIVCYLSMDAHNSLQGYYAKKAGAAGILICDPTSYNNIKADPRSFLLPGAQLTSSNAYQILEMILSNKGCISAKIEVSKEIKEERFPSPTSWSSRGPNQICEDIQKPDVLAVGYNVLTASLPKQGVDGYTFESGTSMATPFVAGAVAHLIRHLMSTDQRWSPAELKSALMTTATPIPLCNMKSKRDILAIGSGLINVKKAEHPGLVFHIKAIDYLRVFKHMGRDVEEIRHCFGEDVSELDPLKGSELNLPTFKSKCPTGSTVTFKRYVRCTEECPLTFEARLPYSGEFDLHVVPERLDFTSHLEVKEFTLTIHVNHWEGCEDDLYSTDLIWEAGDVTVRCPIIITKPDIDGKYTKEVRPTVKVDVKSNKGRKPDKKITPKRSSGQDASKVKVVGGAGGKSSRAKGKNQRFMACESKRVIWRY